MATCMDCIYWDNCEWSDLSSTCDNFKNKSDYVQVVRCKDCKHRGKDECMFHISGEPADEEFLLKCDNDFCSYGERRTDNAG